MKWNEITPTKGSIKLRVTRADIAAEEGQFDSEKSWCIIIAHPEAGDGESYFKQTFNIPDDIATEILDELTEKLVERFVKGELSINTRVCK